MVWTQINVYKMCSYKFDKKKTICLVRSLKSLNQNRMNYPLQYAEFMKGAVTFKLSRCLIELYKRTEIMSLRALHLKKG